MQIKFCLRIYTQNTLNDESLPGRCLNNPTGTYLLHQEDFHHEYTTFAGIKKIIQEKNSRKINLSKKKAILVP